MDMKYITKNYQKYLNIPIHKIIVVFLVKLTMSYIQIKNIIKRKNNVYIFIKALKMTSILKDIKKYMKNPFYCTCCI